jgi:ribosome-associated toxin RatA of RatAB toxin-antitoxin module
MYTLTVERLVDAPAAVVWEVISDIERYADYAPNLSSAHRLSSGEFPARRCYDTQGRSWNEACVLWKEGEAYSYLIDTSDYPYPFIQMKGTWGLTQQNDGVKITMRFDYTPRYPWLLGWLIHRSVSRMFRPIVQQLMENWEVEIKRRAALLDTGADLDTSPAQIG